MTAGIVTVGRKQYAVGLYWENSPSGRISQAAKEAARQSEQKADYYVTRPGNEQGRVPQFGLMTATEGVRAGMPSLAGCLAGQQPGSWIGAFRLREGTALVILRDDLIVPDGDQFFDDESEARDRLYQEMAIGGFQRIYAPETWGVPGADAMPISLLLNDRADIRLKSVALSQRSKLGLLIGGSVLLLATGIGWYIQERMAAEEQARMEQLAALERARQEASRLLPGLQQQPEYPPPERKWEKLPKPVEIVDACQKALGKVPVGVAGWRITSLRCTSTELSIAWQRQPGFSNPPPNASVTDNGGSASSLVSIEGLNPRGHEELFDTDVITKRYLNQNWPGNLAAMRDDPPPPKPPSYTGEWNPPPPPWVKRSFTLSVPVLPWTIPDLLGEIPGIVINSLTMNGPGTEPGGTWTVDGVIYENRH